MKIAPQKKGRGPEAHALDQPGQRLTVGAVAEADVEPLEHREAAIRGRVNVELDGLRS
jgi:hypothetical protein